MKAGLGNTTNGYDLWFTDLVDRELKGAPVTEQDNEYLNAHKDTWKCELINLKRRTETQFTSAKARIFSLYHQLHSKKITYDSYMKQLSEQRVWRVNAARYLEQIENKIQVLKRDINDT